MASSNVVSLTLPDNRDTRLIAQCVAFLRLEEEINEYERAHANDVGRGLGLAPPHEREDECLELLRELCQRQATSLSGIVARVRTLLRFAPARFELSEADGYEELMIAALLRDLASVLKAPDC